MRNGIVVRDPFREFDVLMRRAFGPTAFETAPTGFVPAVESDREGSDAVIRVELPGIDVEKDVEVEVRDGQLVVSGTRRDERSEDEDGRHLREIRYGSFRRSFRLGAGVSADDVSATYDAGVLTIRVAGAYEEPTGQRIGITTREARALDGTGVEATSSETVEE